MKPAADAAWIPQLDGLRAFAVIAVAISHWTPDFPVEGIPWGTGVQLFFVLSGFLITGILLRSRPADLGISMGAALKTFYIRRVLRIFPLYYGVLALCLLFAIGPIHETWPWHAAYLSNIFYAFNRHGPATEDPFLHLWSLSVEEQFYLVWPLIALVASRRALPTILYGAVAGSLAFRLGIDHLVPGIATVRYLTPSCLDAFGIGGLLAYAKHYSGDAALDRLARRFAWVGFVGLLVFVLLLNRMVGEEYARRVGHTFLVFIYGGVVGQAALGLVGLPGRLLSLRPVLYLGRISYGLYVYHYFAPVILGRLGMQFGFETALEQPLFAIPAYIVFTLACAIVSWHFYERPINRLKRRCEYPQSATPWPLASFRSATSTVPRAAGES